MHSDQTDLETATETENALKETLAAYHTAADEAARTGKPILLERLGDAAVAVLPWETYQALERERRQSEPYTTFGRVSGQRVAPASSQVTEEHELWWQEQSNAFEREVAAFERMKGELLQKYQGQYVAVYQGEVVGVGSDKLELTRQLYAKFGPVTMFVHLVAEKEPTYSMPSLQIVDRYGPALTFEMHLPDEAVL